MAADAGVSLGVVVAGALISYTGRAWIDPVVSLGVAAVIFVSAWGLLRESVDLAIDAVPSGIDLEAVKAYLRALPGVSSIHDVHVWGLSTTDTAITAHLVMPAGASDDAFLANVVRELHERFSIEHSTIQLERGSVPCAQAPDDVV